MSNHASTSEITIRPIVVGDLTDILAVQQACYNGELLEPSNALANRWVRSSAVCLVALHGADVVGYLLSHAWHVWTLPKLRVPLPVPDAVDVLWSAHGMAIVPASRGQRLGEQLYAAASVSIHTQGLRQSRLVAAQDADVFWRCLGYQPADVDGATPAALRAVYRKDAELIKRTLSRAAMVSPRYNLQYPCHFCETARVRFYYSIAS